MPTATAFRLIGLPDKDLWECSYPEYQKERISSTFWNDFTIADAYGVKGVQDTFNRAFKEWKSNYKMLTELVGVLNHKIWQHYQTNEELGRLYDKLWKQADAYGSNHLKGDEARFYFAVLD